mgnify:CR=1 FL=1
MKKVYLMLLMMVSLSTSVFGWATASQVISGGDTLTFSSNMSGMIVELDGRQIGVVANNSYVLQLERDGESKTFSFSKPGYKTVDVEVTTKLAGIFWANLLFTGSVGSSVDSWSTKNSRQFTPNQFYIDMVKS